MQTNNKKTESKENMFKVERCGSSLLTSNRKLNFWENCWFLNEIASGKCCGSCSQWSVHCKTWNKKLLTKAGERERLALMTADVWVWVWVYNSTVYNAKGTTWSGSLLWKQARREVGQHWFIYSYIAAYIQAPYLYCPVLLRYTRLVWPPTRGVGRCPHQNHSSATAR